MSTVPDLLSRINELEMRQAFQEATIEELNGVVTQQQMTLSRLQEQLRLLSEKICGLQPTLVAHQSEEVPPPHY